MNIFTHTLSIVFFACRFFLLTGVWFCIPSVQAQSPGGVSTPAFWIKADAGFTGATWADQSGNGITMSLITGSASTTILQNYNPMVASSGYTTFGNSTTQVGTGDDVSAFFVGLSDSIAAAFTICPLPFDITTYSKGPTRFNRRHFVSYENTQTNYPEGPNDVFPAPVKSMISKRNTSGTYYNNASPLAFTPGNTNDGTYPFCEMPDGSLMGEGIIFSRILTGPEIQHVHSYLAVKYGATLVQNYISTSGITVYDVSTYPRGIIGIAQDASTGLLQKQSHTYDDSLKIYIRDSLFVSNAANTNVFPAGGSSIKYLMIGHNDAPLNGRAASTEFPASYTEGSLSIFNRISREWKVTNTSYNGPYSLKIHLDASVAPLTAADLRLMIDTDGDFSNATVVPIGDVNAPAISVSGTLVTIENIKIGLIAPNTTRYLTLASMSSATPLPVHLVHFEAVPQPATRQINLRWTTTDEKENSHFVIERSTDATTFEAIGLVPAQKSASVVLSYVFTDRNPLHGVAYYRLKQVDQDGSYTYSSIRSVRHDVSASGLQVYPNPVSGRLYLSFIQVRTQTTRLELYNSAGQRIHTFRLPATQDFIDMSPYPQGLYYLRMGNQAVKVIRQ